MSERPYLIGLTGNVASGKSVVAEVFNSEGLPVINLDDLGRQLILKSIPVQSELKKIYGPEALTDGNLDSRKMRKILFSSPTIKAKVEKYLHPVIWKAFTAERESLARQGHDKIVCEAALLVESNYHKDMDKLIVVSAPKSERLKRLVHRDNIPQELAEQMMANQMTDQEKESHADEVIQNTGTREELKSKAKSVAKAILKLS